ncbi:hypothetical protein GCM10009557_75110 [Virgisporangium ochraceum]
MVVERGTGGGPVEVDEAHHLHVVTVDEGPQPLPSHRTRTYQEHPHATTLPGERSARIGAMPVQEREADPRSDRPRRWRWARVLVVVAGVVALAVFGLRGRLPAPGDVLDATVALAVPWALLAAALRAASIVAFTLQQQRLFVGLGVRIRLPRTAAVVLSGTALANTMPAGAAVATAYTVREFGRAGATHEVAVASAVVSGLASIGGLTALYAGGGLAVVTSGPRWQPLLVVLVLTAVTAVVIVAGRRFASPRPTDETPAGEGRVARFLRKSEAKRS